MCYSWDRWRMKWVKHNKILQSLFFFSYSPKVICHFQRPISLRQILLAKESLTRSHASDIEGDAHGCAPAHTPEISSREVPPCSASEW